MGLHRGRKCRGTENGSRRKKLTDALIWSLDWGESAEQIMATAMESGGEIPPLPFLVNKPELAEHLEFEWRAFLDLRRDRPTGFDLGRIPWSSIDRYAQRYRIDDLDEFERFARLISAMDDADREHREQMIPPPQPHPK